MAQTFNEYQTHSTPTILNHKCHNTVWHAVQWLPIKGTQKGRNFTLVHCGPVHTEWGTRNAQFYHNMPTSLIKFILLAGTTGTML